jgi:hypothetical protein
VLAHHDRIDDQREFERLSQRRDDFNDLDGSQRAGFGGGRRNIGDDGLDLCGDERRLQRVDQRDSLRVLHRHQSHDGFAVDAELMEGFEIGLDAGAAAWVGTRDGERDGRHPSTLACNEGVRE